MNPGEAAFVTNVLWAVPVAIGLALVAALWKGWRRG